jgi:hypothetical protein
MAIKVTFAPDSLLPTGPTLPILPEYFHVIDAGPTSGLAVWRNPGQPIITNAAEMLANTSRHSTFGRDTLLNDLGKQPFLNSNDVDKGEITFHVRQADADHDGSLADTFRFRFADLADVDQTGVDLWFNGRKVHINPQANGAIDDIDIRLASSTIHFRWDSGTAGHDDGFAMLAPCAVVPVAPVLPQAEIAPIDHFDFHHFG